MLWYRIYNEFSTFHLLLLLWLPEVKRAQLNGELENSTHTHAERQRGHRKQQSNAKVAIVVYEIVNRT